jgi:ubiquinone/menaquinone biosynthesis C-methylase UbiE
MTKFVNPDDIIAQAEIKKGQRVADFGCGAGFYSLSAARFVGDDGAVYAVDVMPDRLAVTQAAAQRAGLKNVTIVQADLEKPLKELDAVSCDLVVLSNILHQVGSKDALLRNAYYVLKTAGHVLAVEWKRGYSVFGPPQSDRIAHDHLVELMGKVGLKMQRDLEADGYHYAVLFAK